MIAALAAGRRFLPRGYADLARQAAIWFGFVFAYQVARGFADRNPAKAFADGVRAADDLDRQLTAIRTAVKGRTNVPPAIGGRIDTLSKDVDKLKGMFRGGFGGPKFQYLDLAGQLQASTSAPTEAQLTAIEHLRTQLSENLTAVNAVITRDLPQLEADLKSNNITTTGVQPVALPKIQ